MSWLRPSLSALLLSLLMAPISGFACTTVLVSGKATVDGRPLLWKNRDTWQPQNEVLYDKSGKYAFVGIVNAEAQRSVWMGTNETGFCIENSLSNDLKTDEAAKGPGNGTLIRMALESCSSVAEFESLLKDTNKTGRQTRGNFGVIDAMGGATMFEVGPKSYRAYDANDESVAPKGVIVRANTSITGSGKKRAIKKPAANAKVLTTRYSGLRYWPRQGSVHETTA